MNLTRMWNTTLLWIVALYMVLNYGFMQVRIPPTTGAGVPIGEVALLLTLISINYTKLLPKLFSLVFAYPFLVWWGLGIGRAFMGVPEYGAWALRDSTHVLESLFLLVGFTFGANPEMIEHFFRLLPKILAVAVVYAAGYPFAGVLASISPTIVSGNGNVVPILFQYVGTANLVLMAGAYLLVFQKDIRIPIISHHPSVIAAGLWGYAAGLFQGRTIYLQIIALLVFFAFYRPKLASRGVLVIVLILGAVALLPVLGLHIKGRLGEEVSINFFINHFLAIGGVSAETDGGAMEGAAHGVEQRHDWWLSIYQRLTSDIWNLLFGLGYGIPLTNFKDPTGVIVREPHNSYISIIARIGLVGAIAWVWLQGQILSVWHSAYKHCVRMNWYKEQNRLFILTVFFILIAVNGLAEDAFEKPFNTIPYYFFVGVMLRYVTHLRNGIISPSTDGNHKAHFRIKPQQNRREQGYSSASGESIV